MSGTNNTTELPYELYVRQGELDLEASQKYGLPFLQTSFFEFTCEMIANNKAVPQSKEIK